MRPLYSNSASPKTSQHLRCDRLNQPDLVLHLLPNIVQPLHTLAAFQSSNYRHYFSPVGFIASMRRNQVFFYTDQRILLNIVGHNHTSSLVDIFDPFLLCCIHFPQQSSPNIESMKVVKCKLPSQEHSSNLTAAAAVQ